MATTFADITFTPSVKAAQTRYGSRDRNKGFETMDAPASWLGAVEPAFV